MALFCEGCGNSMTPDDKFCRVCGRQPSAASLVIRLSRCAASGCQRDQWQSNYQSCLRAVVLRPIALCRSHCIWPPGFIGHS